MARSTKPKPEVDPRAAEAFSGDEGADPTAEDFVPKWLEEQRKAPGVPINYYAEYQAKNFEDGTPAETDTVHGVEAAADGDEK
jgi:hypothetical protein